MNRIAIASKNYLWDSSFSLIDQTFYLLKRELPGRRVLSQLDFSPDEQRGHSSDDGEERNGQEPSSET